MPKKNTTSRSMQRPVETRQWLVPLLTLVFFLVTCLTGGDAMKNVTRILVLVAAATCLVRLPQLRQRLSLPMAAVCLWVLLNGISMFYAVSGRFALIAFMNLAVGVSIFLLILACTPEGADRGRFGASILSGAAALASLVSIDMLSTQFLSNAWIGLMDLLSGGNAGINTNPVEVGVRMVSLYDNPNVFAGIVGLGALLALGLAVSAEGAGERRYHQVCLFLNALAFVLAFSMGASAMIALGFLVLLAFEGQERRGKLFLLMVETFVITLACVFPIYVTAFDGWKGVQPVPLLCAAAGAAGLCLIDQFVGQRLAKALEGKGKALLVTIGAVIVLLIAFVALALNLTGPMPLAAGEGLSRADYPAAGSYTLHVDATGPLNVTIDSQNQQDAMMHTQSTLYSGAADGATFTVPEDSLVVHFRFNSAEAVTVNAATYEGAAGSGELALKYKLLPGFIANRLQGLKANQNAIQRTVFFADGMKLFRRSPVFGLGIGAFENAILGVQSFFYETKYAHNHYIETLVTTGVVGLVLFVGMLGLCAVAVWKNLRKKADADPLAPALAAALVFLAGHAAVEVILSLCYYLPMAFGVLALICLCCGQELPLPGKKQVHTGVTVALAVPLAIFAVLLSLNISMENMLDNGAYNDGFAALKQAADLDVFDHDSYKISYVLAAQDVDPVTRSQVRTQADKYAVELAKVDSNSIPIYLAQYYFNTERPEQAIEMLKKHVGYSAADSRAWQDAFGLLISHYNDAPETVRQGVQDIYQSFQAWNENNIGTITLDQDAQQFIDLILSVS